MVEERQVANMRLGPSYPCSADSVAQAIARLRRRSKLMEADGGMALWLEHSWRIPPSLARDSWQPGAGFLAGFLAAWLGAS